MRDVADEQEKEELVGGPYGLTKPDGNIDLYIKIRRQRILDEIVTIEFPAARAAAKRKGEDLTFEEFLFRHYGLNLDQINQQPLPQWAVGYSPKG